MEVEQELKFVVSDISDLIKIEDALEILLNISNKQLGKRIIEKIIKYLDSKLSDSSYKIKVFIAHTEFDILGFVVTQIDPEYRSYGKVCPTFGWIRATSFEVCEKLIKCCEEFAKDNGFRKIRGPINFPKKFGGIGAQVQGFNERILYGVAFNPPEIPLYLDKLKYKRDAEYICVEVTVDTWGKERQIDDSIRLGYLSYEELINRQDEFMELIDSSFNVFLPDYGGASGFREVMDLYAQVPKDYYKLPPNFEVRNHTDVPQFIEAIESCDLENVLFWVVLAFDRKTEKIVGAIFTTPDGFQLYINEHITRTNVDSALIKSEYRGKRIFSSLNNLGHIVHRTIYGISFVEGTNIWNKNEKAVQSIFPHGEPLKRHYVFQGRIRR